MPDTLRQLWTAASPHTLSPIVVGGTVVTGDGRTVDGRDPQTGESRWTYARDTDLCGVSYVYDLAVAVYPDVRGCGQVSSINGRHRPARPDPHRYADNAHRAQLRRQRGAVRRADPAGDVALGSGADAVLRRDRRPGQTGQHRLGDGLHADVGGRPATPPSAVLEACRDQKDLRLTLLKPAKEEDEPDTKHVPLPGVAADSEARVLAVSGTTTAVYLPDPQARGRRLRRHRHQGLRARCCAARRCWPARRRR